MKSDCQSSLGRSAANRRHEDRGRFCGCGATRPAAVRIRQTVAREIVTPSRASISRDGVGAGVQPVGDQLVSQRQDPVPDDLRGAVRARSGRLDCGSNAASPSASQRRCSLCTSDLGHAVAGSDLPVGESLDGDGFDEHLVLGHRPRCPETSHDHQPRPSTMSRDIRPRCPETRHLRLRHSSPVLTILLSRLYGHSFSVISRDITSASSMHPAARACADSAYA